MRRRHLAGWLLALAAPLQALEPWLLTGARVLSPDGTTWLEGRAVLVRDGRIEGIDAPERLASPGSCRVLDLDGLYLVPGLIELHAHLLLHPYDETPWETQVLKESLELRTVRGVAAARATLESGFTTLRELGTEGAGYADVGLREAIAQGIVPGPRVFASTRAIVALGGYGPFGFDPRFDLPKGGQVASGVEDVRRVTREQIAAGADWIKVYADYRRRPGAPSTPTFSPEELEAIVAEAARAGIPVAAHASTDTGIRAAVEAGVRTIEHGTEASRETLLLLRESGTVLCPTLAAGDAIARYGGWRPGEPEPERLVRARETFRLALELGVPIACGSDVGVFPHGESWRELDLMAAWGMPLADVLASATSRAADVLGRSDLGRLAPGATADLVALASDPLADAGAYRDVAWVMKEGQVAVDRRGTPDDGERTEVLAPCLDLLEALARDPELREHPSLAPGAVLALADAGRPGEAPPGAPVDAAAWARDAEVHVLAGTAAVTARFTSWDGERTSTGADLVQLVRLEGSWRVRSLARSLLTR